MKVKYTVWEPDKGLEDIQAKIFSYASGIPERAEVIRQRNLQRAPEMTRYALTEDGEPLAYVTARDSSKFSMNSLAILKSARRLRRLEPR